MEMIRVPKVAEAVTEGTVSRWHVAVGDRVAADVALVEMITEKAEDDVRSPVAGRVAAVYAPERSTVPVGYVLCVLAEEDEQLPDVEAINAEVLARHRAMLMGELPPEDAADTSPSASQSAVRTPPSRIAASPAARRLAREQGVDLGAVASRLGISGQVAETDVRRFLAEEEI
jgi:pyruvate/2-oxoglutarate dehydrogenase complex dihydrolipoamide acyltransferase (E2) component